MTIKIEKPGLAERILKLFGKTRQVVVPDDAYKHDPHTYIHAKRESFWKALFRKLERGYPLSIFSFIPHPSFSR